MSWIKFHEELTRAAKRGLPRAVRFIYLELSLLARAGRGTVALPEGMGDLEGMVDLLGGDRKEVLLAHKRLTAGAEPMIAFEGDEGARRIVVRTWGKWNRVDDSAERVKRHRAAKDETPPTPPSNGPVTRYTSVTPEVGNADVTAPDQSRSDPSGGADAAAPSPPPAEPEQPAKRQRKATAGTREPAPPSPASEAWALWLAAYLARWGVPYVRSGEDGKVIGRLVAGAAEQAPGLGCDAPGLLGHWFKAYLDDSATWLLENRHPLRTLDRGLPTYGAPKPPAPEVATAPIPPPRWEAPGPRATAPDHAAANGAQGTLDAMVANYGATNR